MIPVNSCRKEIKGLGAIGAGWSSSEFELSSGLASRSAGKPESQCLHARNALSGLLHGQVRASSTPRGHFCGSVTVADRKRRGMRCPSSAKRLWGVGNGVLRSDFVWELLLP